MGHLIVFLISLFAFQAFMAASDGCTEVRTTPTKIFDKAVSMYDSTVPVLLHDPARSIQFHLDRATSLYQEAVRVSQSNPGRAINLSFKAQNHLTLLEADIRNIGKGERVSYNEIFTQLEKISLLRKSLGNLAPSTCTGSLTMLSSFQERTDQVLKKLYYESLVPQ